MFFRLVVCICLVLGRCRIMLVFWLVWVMGVWLLCICSCVIILLFGVVLSVVRLSVCVKWCWVVGLLLVRGMCCLWKVMFLLLFWVRVILSLVVVVML